MHEDPACAAVDRNKQMAARCLVWHLRQVLDVDVDADRFAFRLRDDVFQSRHPFPFDQARNAGTRYLRIDILPCNEKQVVERQVQADVARVM
jgi:hypothetical protein